ncbi:hypothetical protein [Chryseobacterium sp.]|uniref:hypothetical protein n=1 Tax=Chryseobacterium sp. TaxID=1871047 RepID=UPI001E4E9264|nr:hypothetical protein [Chryseobacterium sp.]
MSIKILEILIHFTSLILFAAILLFPFFIHKKLQYRNYSKLISISFSLILCLLISAILTFVAVYWFAELSDNILLKKMGYNENGMNEFEYFEHVPPHLLQKAKEIRESQMGIGWPLKAIFSFVFFIFPYNLTATIVLGLKCRTADNAVRH